MRPHDNDPQTVDRLVNENIRLAYFMAHKYAWITDYADALSLAQEGLLSSARSWKPADGPFGTFAGNKIRWTIVRDYKRSLAVKRGGVGQEGSRRRSFSVSLDAPVGQDSEWNRSFGEVIPDDRLVLPGEELGAREEVALARAEATRLLAMITPRNRRIIELRFGFFGAPALTLEEIASKVGLTRERVRQIVDESLRHFWRVKTRKKMEPVKIAREMQVA